MAQGNMVGGAPLEKHFPSGYINFLEKAIVDPAQPIMSDIRAVYLLVLVYCEQRSSIIRYFEFVEIASHVNVDRINGMRDFIRGIELRRISAARFQILSAAYHVVRAIGMWSPTCSRPEGQEIFSLVPLYLQIHRLSKLALRPHQIAPRVKNYRSWIGNINASRAHQN